jgi:hypothetical protein
MENLIVAGRFLKMPKAESAALAIVSFAAKLW